MELSWSTFVLEIINFLVLVWILKRFLYRPVLDVIARRRAGIEQRLAEAEARHADAEQLRTQYEGRLAEWDRERRKARDALAQELESERSRRLDELQQTLEQEREKSSVAEARRQADARHRIETEALLLGARFASRLLQQASGPELETRLVELVLVELEQMPDERIAGLQPARDEASAVVTVTSAYPLAEAHRTRLEQWLTRRLTPSASVQFGQDAELQAGVRITAGSRVLGANVQDELRAFSELAHEV
jgi:F-type H+-transporting ATPase subunit b